MSLSNSTLTFVFLIILKCVLAYETTAAADIGDIEFPFGVFSVFHITDGIYVYGDSTTNGMFVVSDKGVIVIDGPRDHAPWLPTMVSSVTDLPIHTVIYSHHHRDHIGGVGLYESTLDIEYIAHENTVRELLNGPSSFDPNVIPLPTKLIRTYKKRDIPSLNDINLTQSLNDIDFIMDSYTKETKYKLGNQTILFSQPFTVHSISDMWIQVITDSIHIICIIDSLYGPFVTPWGPVANVNHFNDMTAVLDNYDEWDYILSGHATKFVTRDDLELAIEFNTDVTASMGEAMQTVPFGGIPVSLETFVDIFAEYIDSLELFCMDRMIYTYGWGISEGKMIAGTNTTRMLQACRYSFYNLFAE